jgi:hypothetical protein
VNELVNDVFALAVGAEIGCTGGVREWPYWRVILVAIAIGWCVLAYECCGDGVTAVVTMVVSTLGTWLAERNMADSGLGDG